MELLECMFAILHAAIQQENNLDLLPLDDADSLED